MKIVFFGMPEPVCEDEQQSSEQPIEDHESRGAEAPNTGFMASVSLLPENARYSQVHVRCAQRVGELKTPDHGFGLRVRLQNIQIAQCG